MPVAKKANKRVSKSQECMQPARQGSDDAKR